MIASLLAAGVVASGVPALGAAPARAAYPVPAALVATESYAEDIVDDALSGDRGSAAAKAASLRAGARGAAAGALARAGVPPVQVAQLGARADRVARLANRGSLVAVALAANAVSELMPDLYRHFASPVPAAVLTLDYLDREAQLRSLARQPEKVADAVKALAPTWARVRPRVVAAGGTEEAAAYQRHVSAMQRLHAGSGRTLQSEAIRGLALVDDLERVFS